MKKIGIIILVLLFCSTIKAQSFVFGAFNLMGATNVMSFSELERPLWELGFSQNLTIITRNGREILDESGEFLTID